MGATSSSTVSSQPDLQQSQAAIDKVSFVWERYQSAKQLRSANRYFNDRDLVSYVQDSVDRWNGRIVPRTDPAQWGANVFSNVTRRKAIAILSQVTANPLKGEYFATSKYNRQDQAAARLAKTMNDHASYINHDDEQQFFAALEAMIKGTAIGFENFLIKEVTKREVTYFNPLTQEMKYEEKTYNEYDDVYSEVIPLLDFFPGNIYQRNMQKQPFVVWRSVMGITEFKSEYSMYSKAKSVKPGGDISKDDIYRDMVSGDLLNDEVEVIRYFNRDEDEMIIVANGVLLTPMISPFPWNHKMYPFWSMQFEPFAIDFFYGKSLPDKLKSDQDVLNVLYRMLIDQTYLSIHRPIITTGIENLKDRFIYPGAQMKVEDVSQFKEFEISAPNPAQFNMLNMVDNNLNKDSVDNASQGISGSNSTAFEVSVANDAAKKLLTLVLRSMEWGVAQKLNLRVKNQFQFYQRPLIENIGDDETVQLFEQFRSIEVPKTQLADGTMGTQVIRIVEHPSDLPTKLDLDRMEAEERAQGRNTAFSYITIDFLQKIDTMVQIIPNSGLKMSESLRRALELDYQDKSARLFPDLLNRVEAFRELNEVYDKDPNRMMQTPQQPPQQIPGQDPNTQGPFNPNGNTAMQGMMATGGNETMNSPRGFIREGAKRA